MMTSSVFLASVTATVLQMSFGEDDSALAGVSNVLLILSLALGVCAALLCVHHVDWLL